MKHYSVMAGLVPAIHALLAFIVGRKTWNCPEQVRA